jgi:membrane protein YqaA with SNARE-associated domain
LKSFQAFLLKYKIYVLHLLAPLGFWGAGAIALIDSASMPVPMDILIAGYIWNDKSHFYLYCLLGATGSALGGLVPFFLGRAGGEIFLLKRVDRARYEQLRDRFEKQEFLAMMIPSMMPPPTPWKAFVFGAGVFEMKIANFMLAVFVGRLIHYSILSLLVIRYGPRIVEVVTDLAQKHLAATLIGLGVLLGLLALFVVRKTLKKKKGGDVEAEPQESNID